MSFPGGMVLLTQAAVRSETSDKRHRLGTVGRTIDGRIYHYAVAGEELSIGIPITSVAAHPMTAPNDYINDTEEITSTFGNITLSSTVSTWGVVKNEFADGFFVVEDTTQTASSAGQMLIIDSNTYGSTSTTNTPYESVLTFMPDSRVTKTLSTDDSCYLVHSPYYNVIEHDGGADPAGGIVGVPNLLVTDAYYFWAQTWGPCPVLQDGTLVNGEYVVGSTQTNQGVQAIVIAEVATTSDTELSYVLESTNIQRQIAYQKVGYLMGEDCADGDWGLLFLTISP